MLMVPGRFIIIDQGYSATPIGHFDEYPTTHYFRIPRHTQSMNAYKILT